MQKTIAVLAVQGAFAEHKARLESLGCKTIELRQRGDLQRPFDGLVLPGGESTVQAKLLRDLGLFAPLQQLIQEGLPVLGTCAGLILLAEQVQSTSDGRPRSNAESAAAVAGFATLPVTVLRNGYGRQLGSFIATAPLHVKQQSSKSIPLTFIRAPRILSAAPNVEPLVALKGEPVAVRFRNQIGCCFHPELDQDDRLYQLFLAKC